MLAAGIAIGVVLSASPASSHVAGWTHNWTKHIRPKADKRYLPGGNLPSGRTIRGTYRVAGIDGGAGLDLNSTSISFGFTLSAAPSPHFRPMGALPTSQCPGTAANPRAAAGHLCVYEAVDNNAQGQLVGNPITNAVGAATRYGAFVLAQSVVDGTWSSSGTWAVTAP